jgi:hypothetical protein
MANRDLTVVSGIHGTAAETAGAGQAQIFHPNLENLLKQRFFERPLPGHEGRLPVTATWVKGEASPHWSVS